MTKVTAKFWAKNANAAKTASYEYVGSLQVEPNASRQSLLAHAESIGGPIYGPLIAMTEDSSDVTVLQFY